MKGLSEIIKENRERGSANVKIFVGGNSEMNKVIQSQLFKVGCYWYPKQEIKCTKIVENDDIGWIYISFNKELWYTNIQNEFKGYNEITFKDIQNP